MLWAIFSDVHADIESLEKIYKDIQTRKPDRIICLGDIVGYGNKPSEVIRFLRQHRIRTLKGNHEHAVFDDRELEFFNKEAYDAIIETRKILSAKELDYLKKLPVNFISKEICFVHGIPSDDFEHYINNRSQEELVEIFKIMRQKIAFVGHTHFLEIFSFDGEKVNKKNLEKSPIQLEKNQKHIVSVGSVSQPRDGNKASKYVLLDDKALSVQAIFVK